MTLWWNLINSDANLWHKAVICIRLLFIAPNVGSESGTCIRDKSKEIWNIQVGTTWRIWNVVQICNKLYLTYAPSFRCFSYIKSGSTQSTMSRLQYKSNEYINETYNEIKACNFIKNLKTSTNCKVHCLYRQTCQHKWWSTGWVFSYLGSKY